MDMSLYNPDEAGSASSHEPAVSDSTDPGDRPAPNPAHILLENGTALPLQAGSTLVGRLDPVEEVNCDLDLGLHGGFEKGVSRRHALFCRDEEGYRIEDVGSTNGTVVNRIRIQPQKPHPLKDGDVIYLGSLKVVFQAGDR